MENHLMLNMLAGEAIQSYYLTEDKLDWLDQYEELYERCTYGPEGLPKIGSVHIDGIEFRSIGEFVFLYKKTGEDEPPLPF